MLDIENHPKPKFWDYPLLGLFAGVLVAIVIAPYLVIAEKFEKFRELC